MKAIEVKHVSYNTKTFQIKDLHSVFLKGLLRALLGVMVLARQQ